MARALFSVCLAAAFAGASPSASGDAVRAGGETTQKAATRDAFSLPAANLPPDRVRDFFRGNRLFNTDWLPAPDPIAAFDGLGPTFNSASCAGCHVRDGRGRPPADEAASMDAMLVRISLPGRSANGEPRPHPVYGSQIQHRAVPGVPAEGRVAVRYGMIEGRYGDGTSYTLRKPVYTFRDLAFGPLDADTLYSPRVATAVFGLGLLEAVPDETLLGMADPEDFDGDGISGRVNRVFDAATDRTAIGRFGWKAGQPSLRNQIAAALRDDMGITTPLHPEENCPPAQRACRGARNGGSPEIGEAFMDMLTFYMRTLAVPASRDVGDSQVERGRALFSRTGCAACHVPVLESGDHPNAVAARQRFAPYTDLLLHDMGEALADHRPDSEATGREWRTPPLWGLGLISTVNNHQELLHDGRARGPAEAILWHGGEAERAKEEFRTLSASDRAALIRFLDSL